LLLAQCEHDDRGLLRTAQAAIFVFPRLSHFLVPSSRA
jgi:hypothetical protein